MFYIKQNGKIIGFSSERYEMERALLDPLYEDLEIIETEENQVIVNSQLMTIEQAEQIEAQAREADFNSQFFQTSLGYIRRKVNMLDGSTKDFLTDILPLLVENVPIITYNKPTSFNEDVTPTQNLNVLITETFINECKQRLLLDFYGAEVVND